MIFSVLQGAIISDWNALYVMDMYHRNDEATPNTLE